MNPAAQVPSIPGNPINFFPSLRPPRPCGKSRPESWVVQLESNQHLRGYEPRALPLSYRPSTKVEVRPGVAPGKAVLQTAGSTASPCAPGWGVRPVLPRFLDVHSVVCSLLHYELHNARLRREPEPGAAAAMPTRCGWCARPDPDRGPGPHFWWGRCPGRQTPAGPARRRCGDCQDRRQS